MAIVHPGPWVTEANPSQSPALGPLSDPLAGKLPLLTPKGSLLLPLEAELLAPDGTFQPHDRTSGKS